MPAVAIVFILLAVFAVAVLAKTVRIVPQARAGVVVAGSAIDNLVKGAAGQAVQNANLMCGLAEDAGLVA